MIIGYLEEITMWLALSLSVVIVCAAVFYLFYSNYSNVESKTIHGIGDYANHLYDRLDRMFKRKPLRSCYTIILVSTVVFALIGLFGGFRFGFLPGIILAGLLGFIGFKMPKIIVDTLFQRRVDLFDRQLVDALSMMSNGLKSGLAFMQVVSVIEQEMPNPCSQEFGLVLKENRVGVNLNDALLNMTHRVPSEDLFMIINSVVTLSQQGGDLSEAFETIADTIRERQRVKEKIRTMAQAGIFQGLILSALPFTLLAIFTYVQPETTGLLYSTTIGNLMLAAIVAMVSTGALWMRQILKLDI